MALASTFLSELKSNNEEILMIFLNKKVNSPKFNLSSKVFYFIKFFFDNKKKSIRILVISSGFNSNQDKIQSIFELTKCKE